MKSYVDLDAVRALLKSNADFGRLGGLLKQHFAQEDDKPQWHDDLRRLLKSLESSRRDVATGMKEIMRQLLAGKLNCTEYVSP